MRRGSHDEQGDGVDEDHVDRADERGGAEPSGEERSATDRPYDERLQEAAFGVSPDDRVRQEDREHRSEEEHREDREAEERRAEEHLRVDDRQLVAVAHRLRRARVDRLVGLVDPEAVEPEEGQCEDEHDREDAAADALPHRVARDDDGASQLVSPSTASR